ncbi:Ubiquitin domain-containing protein DSK2 [Fusarium oxysporum f. sp. cubense]|uniref:Ubiquitin domain-containing protein DSK2 n=1 Tax=Fusarium oxysporum f. sp. cubense TaxID=61366 RepID=A0A559LLE9_FUSOC|nr:Ubiquitin domain-containing protein DSK2 [Fusarium oxysporum f. sp. cubense]
MSPANAMADNPQSSNDSQITFNVEALSGSTLDITMGGTETVSDLWSKLAKRFPREISADSPRLIFSGQVMANDKALSAYGIKSGNTVFIHNNAARNHQSDPTSNVNTPASTPISANIGTTNRPFANSTDTMYGGSGSPLAVGMCRLGGRLPPWVVALEQLVMGTPSYHQHAYAAMQEPDFFDNMIDRYFTLQNDHEDRRVLNSLTKDWLFANPEIIEKMTHELQSSLGGMAAAFPAPGITDTTPENVVFGGSSQVQQEQNNSLARFVQPDLMGVQEGKGSVHDVMSPMRELDRLRLKAIIERWYEDLYAEQLRQLNDEGFYDFDDNVDALGQVCGSVEGAIEYLKKKKLDNVSDRS